MSKKVVSEEKERKKVNRWFKFMHVVYHIFLHPVFPVKKYGYLKPLKDKTYAKGAYIIVGNHLSVYDVIPAAMVANRSVRFMAKSELFEKGISKSFTKKCGCISVNRDGNDLKAVMQALKCLKAGEIVCIFPEGTRNKSGEKFLPFKSGAAMLSLKTQTPIIPIVQVKKMKPFRRARVYFGEPFEFTEYYGKKPTQEDIEACDEILRKKMEETYDTLFEILNKGKKCK